MAMTVHEAVEVAMTAGRCPSCGRFGAEPCLFPEWGRPRGLHVARFVLAASKGLLHAEDLAVLAAPGSGRMAPDAVIYDPPEANRQAPADLQADAPTDPGTRVLPDPGRGWLP